MRRLLVACLACAVCLSADTGVLIPGDRQQPDPALWARTATRLLSRIGTDNGLVRIAEGDLR